MKHLSKLFAAVLLSATGMAANATQWNVTWTADMQPITFVSPSQTIYGLATPTTLTGVVEGTLQGDGNTVLVSDIISWTINSDNMGSADFASGGVGTFSNYFAASSNPSLSTFDGAAIFTLDGSVIDLVASNALTDTYIEFMNVSFGPSTYANAGFAYYGTGSTHEYNGGAVMSTGVALSSWSMTPVSGGGGGGPISPVPEPASALLMLAGVPLLMAASRRRRTAQR